MMVLMKFIMIMAPILISVAFITLLERKVLGLVGLRLGPNKVSLMGLLQPLGDALKLGSKTENFLYSASPVYYSASAGGLMLCTMMAWSSMSGNPSAFDIKCSCLMILAMLGLSSYFMIVAGWSTFGKMPLIGCLRTVSQLISYEGALYFLIMIMFFSSSSFSISSILSFNNSPFLLLFPFFIFLWLPTILAELNRTPFDFSEGESELVGGFMTEHGGKAFSFLSLVEYSYMILLGTLMWILIIYPISSFFLLTVMLLTLWSRAVLPRYRYDKLMTFCWKVMIPLTTMVFAMLYLLSF